MSNIESKTKWTPAQLSAITSKNKSLLISAAAGSGKTATLTEKIVRSLTDPENGSDISKMLIVTYTKAAASELKERISSALAKALETDPTNKKLTRQLLSLPSADISTIHSFCLRVIKPNFQHFALPPNFRVGDDAELKLTKKTIMDNLIDEYYEESRTPAAYAGTFDFVRLADTLTGSGSGDDAALPVLLISLYEKLCAYPESISLLDKFADTLVSESEDGDFLSTRHGKTIIGAFVRKLRHYELVFQAAVSEFSEDEDVAKAYLPAFEDTLTSCASISKAAASDTLTLQSLKDAADRYAPARLGNLKKEFQTERTDFYKDERKKFADDLKEIRTKLLSVSEEKIRESVTQTALICRDLGVVLADFERNYLDYKRMHGLCDYGDLERYAHRLLYNDNGSPSDIAADFAMRYDEIYIDEYQDTNELQDRIFSAVSRKNNRFMVGDIKQSIYKFRGAEPSIFASYRTKFPPLIPENDSDEAAIFMSNNFRCDRTVIDFVNTVSRYMFYNSAGIPYDESDDLIFSKSPPHDEYVPAPAQIFLIEKKRFVDGAVDESETAVFDDGGTVADEADSDTETDDTIEARFVAEQICHLIKHGKKADGSRIRAGDIAILLRSPGSSAERFKAALEEKNITALSNGNEDFFEKPEILLMTALLHCIDNPTRDTYLAGVMMSPLFGFSIDDLIELRRYASDVPLYNAVKGYADSAETVDTEAKKHKSIRHSRETLRDKCVNFRVKLESYRASSRGMPTDKMIWYLLRDTGILAILGGKMSNEGRAAETVRRSLMMFYEYARKFESSSYRGLYNFIRYITGIIDENAKTDMSAETPENAEDTVTITSIHKSKGLEYPICFICGTSKKRNTEDLKKNLIFDDNLGVTVKLKEKKNGLVRYNTLLRQAACVRISDSQTEEEMRALYVAMTRARERLIITSAITGAGKFSKKNSLAAQFTSDESVYAAPSYIDWIMAATAVTASQQNNADDSAFEIRIIDSGDDISENYVTKTADFVPEIEQIVTRESESVSESKVSEDDEITAMTQVLSARFSYKYPHAHLSAIPAKLVVSKLNDAALDAREDAVLESLSIDSAVVNSAAGGEAAENDEENKLIESIEKAAVSDNGMRECPRFMRGDDLSDNKALLAARSGTATHIFMQFCDFNQMQIGANSAEITTEIDRLIRLKFISPGDAKLINKRHLGSFFTSETYKTIKSADKLWREFRFNVYLNASDFTRNPELKIALRDEQILVQGVVDCLLRDSAGEYVLIDYKTDYLTSEEISSPDLAAQKLTGRHRAQLAYYKMACERMLPSPIKKTAIYSLPLGDCVWIDA